MTVEDKPIVRENLRGLIWLTYLEDFDLTTSRMNWLLMFFTMYKCVNMNTKYNTLLTTVFFGCELCTDTIDLQKEINQHT